MKYSVVMSWHFAVEGEYMPNENIAQQVVEQLTENYLKDLCMRLDVHDKKLYDVYLCDEQIKVIADERNSRQ